MTVTWGEPPIPSLGADIGKVLESRQGLADRQAVGWALATRAVFTCGGFLGTSQSSTGNFTLFAASTEADPASAEDRLQAMFDRLGAARQHSAFCNK